MALSNAERQKRWREKNRAVYNLQQRNRRKKGGDVSCPDYQTSASSPTSSNAASTVQPAGAAKIEELRELLANLRELLAKESARKPEPVMKMAVYRDDCGRVISEARYQRLQEKKAAAKEKGFVIDEYSQ